MYKLSQRSLKRLKGVDKRLVSIVKEAIHNSPYDFGIAWMGGYRTAEMQNDLYSAQKSKCDGYKKKSKHQTGLAFDIVVYKDGVITWDSNTFSDVADHIMYIATTKGVTLTWGGNWRNFRDLPHFEI